MVPRTEAGSTRNYSTINESSESTSKNNCLEDVLTPLAVKTTFIFGLTFLLSQVAVTIIHKYTRNEIERVAQVYPYSPIMTLAFSALCSKAYHAYQTRPSSNPEKWSLIRSSNAI